MIHVYTGDSIKSNSNIFDLIHRFRHEIFVDELGWSALNRVDRREIDQFDDEYAIHIVDIIDKEIRAYSRLLPTNRPHLLSHVYPELMQGSKSPRADRIYEWTRLAARSDRRGRDSTPIRRIMVGVAEIYKLLGLKGLIAQSDPLWVKRLVQLGWEARSLAVPVMYEGRMVVPLEARITANTITISRRVLGIHTSVVLPSALSGIAFTSFVNHSIVQKG
jgi:acyl-homoserine lactone synthase